MVCSKVARQARLAASRRAGAAGKHPTAALFPAALRPLRQRRLSARFGLIDNPGLLTRQIQHHPCLDPLPPPRIRAASGRPGPPASSPSSASRRSAASGPASPPAFRGAGASAAAAARLGGGDGRAVRAGRAPAFALPAAAGGETLRLRRPLPLQLCLQPLTPSLVLLDAAFAARAGARRLRLRLGPRLGLGLRRLARACRRHHCATTAPLVSRKPLSLSSTSCAAHRRLAPSSG